MSTLVSKTAVEAPADQQADSPTSADSRSESVPIARIVVPDGRRPPRNVRELAGSIAELGLLNPITVTPDHRLIAGRNRLEACRSLGWTHIPAVVLRLDRLHAELAEIDENLIRNELSALERCEQTKRRKDVYEAIYPQTRSVNVKGGPGRGHKKAKETAIESTAVLIPDVLEEPPVPSFAADQAAKTGQAEVTVRREVQIASAIPEALRDRIRATPLADRKDDLLKLAKLEPAKQEAVVAAIRADAKLTFAQALRQVQREAKRAELEAMATAAAAVVTTAAATWEVIEGDCLDALPGIEAGSVRLAFADPPYNIGVDYGSGKAADRRPGPDYLDWCRAWMAGTAGTLAPDGSFWVLICHEWAASFELILRDDLGLDVRDWITWYESFGVNRVRGFNRCSRRLLHAVKDPAHFVFHEDTVTRASDRAAIYGDKRADPGGKIWDDVWGIKPPIPRLVDNARERLDGFPTQLPLALLRAVVGCASDPGDLVLDPFNGSGTTGAAAIELGRRYLGIEQSGEFARRARLRLSTTKGGIDAA